MPRGTEEQASCLRWRCVYTHTYKNMQAYVFRLCVHLCTHRVQRTASGLVPYVLFKLYLWGSVSHNPGTSQVGWLASESQGHIGFYLQVTTTLAFSKNIAHWACWPTSLSANILLNSLYQMMCWDPLQQSLILLAVAYQKEQ